VFLAAWSGLVGGLAEVAVRVLPRSMGVSDRLFLMSRHFVWLAPLSNLALLLALGIFLAALTAFWPRQGRFLSPRIICALALLPALMVSGPRVYAEAWLILSLGIAAWVVPALGRHPARLRRWLLGSFPVLFAAVLGAAAFVFGIDHVKQWRETRRPLPPEDAPNVLLVVLDTVRADHTSLYGYARATTPALERLARKGIRFENARATAPWTLPSHASMFTGRWPHELQAKWSAHLRGNFSTLAEYLGSRGYATAGFAANAVYCSYDTGLDRGFTHYEDYVLENLSPLRTARIIDCALQTASGLSQSVGRYLGLGTFGPWREFVGRWFFAHDRRDAASINRQFLSWLSHRAQPRRPFFAFLNYLDAHVPYVLPEGAWHQFGLQPQTRDEFQVVFDRWLSLDKPRLPQHFRTLARDCYDNCLAYLDQKLGALLDELERRGELDRTLIVVTSDHGEGFGEHNLYEHGESLYRTEIHVPLLIVMPSRERAGMVIPEAVSLRDLPATIVELAGWKSGSPFPGRSLARLWRGAARPVAPDSSEAVISELHSASPLLPNQGRSPAQRGPLVSLADGDLVYIRNLGDGAEELFDEREDARELSNRVRHPAMRPFLERFRRQLDNIIIQSYNYRSACISTRSEPAPRLQE
jgi:arylsulfatase A-like enzyme